MSVTIEQARKVLEIIDHGLTFGLGTPEPGKLCVEAAVCLALGEPHGDEPSCVAEPDRRFKIRLNDSSWSSPEARAKGLRALGVAQLGTKDLDRRAWVKRVVELTIRRVVPWALRRAAVKNQKHAEALEAAATRCEAEGTRDAAIAARDAAYAYAAVDAYAAAAYYAAVAAAACYAATAAADADADAADAADATYATYAAATAATAASTYAATDADAYADAILTIAADCALQAYRETGSPGVTLLDQLLQEEANG